MSDFMELDILSENRLDLNTKLTIYKSYDGQKIHGKVSYMGNRLVSEKVEDNSELGLQRIKAFLDKFKSGKDVEKYFNIKGGIKVNLEKIVEQIKETRALANEVIDEQKSNPSTLQTRKARKRAAMNQLSPLYNQYKSELMKRTFAILLVGDKAKEAADMLAEDGMVSVSADDFYEDLLNRIPKQFYDGKTQSSALFDVVTRHIDDKAGEIDIGSYPMATFTRKYSEKVDSRDKALGFVKRIVNLEVGPEILGYDALEKAAKIAVAQDFAGLRLPLVVSLTDKSIAKEVSEGLKKTSKLFHMITIEVKDDDLKGSASVKKLTKENLNKAIEAIKTNKKGE